MLQQLHMNAQQPQILRGKYKNCRTTQQRLGLYGQGPQQPPWLVRTGQDSLFGITRHIVFKPLPEIKGTDLI